ncbi:PucR family transcriptional regulator [Pseudactinotalea suaedae]|uniref:PucR family transcriptional regulator n=1 Tax=Pseudactinotalea suaedae TaxID=1524924 RepID=UPI001391A8CB|nr:PucR family transcriptional regulator [Pseudactinotalea suaedae]
MATVTLAELLAAPALRLRTAVAPRDSGPFAWVHSTDLIDPARFLPPATVVLTTGQQLADGSDAELVTRYVSELVRGGVSALGFGLGVVHERTPATLVRSCRDQQLPLFEVPFEVPFLAVATHVARASEAARAERVAWTQRAIAELTRSAHRRDGLDEVLGACARLLSGPVALVTARRVRSWAADGRRSEPSSAWAPVLAQARSLLAQGRAATAAVEGPQGAAHLYTVGALGAMSGVLACSPGPEPDAAHRAVMATAAGLASLAVSTADRVWVAMATARQAAFELALGGAIGAAEDVLSALDGEVGDERYLVVCIRGAAQPLPSVLPPGVTELRRTAADSLLVIEGAARAVDHVRAVMPPAARAGISGPHPLADLALAFREAAAAADSARAGAVAVFDDLADSPWSHLTVLGQHGAIAEGFLDRLGDRRDELLPALRAWLDNGTQWEPAARALGMHRHTLRNLVEEAGRALDRDLSSAVARAELTWALAVAGATGEASP